MKGASYIILGSRGRDHIEISVVGRVYPGATDYWDANWLSCEIDIKAGAFEGRLAATLRAEELSRFRSALEHLRDLDRGVAAFETMEEWLFLDLSMGADGDVNVTGRMVDQPGVGNVLSFRLRGFEREDLGALIAAFTQVESDFPVLGSSRASLD